MLQGGYGGKVGSDGILRMNQSLRPFFFIYPISPATSIPLLCAQSSYEQPGKLQMVEKDRRQGGRRGDGKAGGARHEGGICKVTSLL